MALLKYLKASKNGLPDPKVLCQVPYPLEQLQKLIGKLSNFYHMQMEGSEDLINGMSILVNILNMRIKFNLYHVARYSLKERLAIARYTCHHGSQQLQYVS